MFAPQALFLHPEKLTNGHLSPVPIDPTDTFIRSLTVGPIAREDGRRQPIFRKVIVFGTGLASKSTKRAAAPVASPDGVGMQLQGWQMAAAHGVVIIIKKVIDRKPKIRLNVHVT